MESSYGSALPAQPGTVAMESASISKMDHLESIFETTMIGATATAYPWRPVLHNAATQLRLLYLPAQDLASGMLKVDLEVFEITEAPAFQALSYTWRSPFPDEHQETPSYHDVKSGRWSVICNGHQIQATRNLYEALEKLVVEFPNTYLWNDVTCINQQDVAEVNVQVGIMADIYATASRVIIWLGTDDEETPKCFQLHQQVGGPLAELTNNGELGATASSTLSELYRLHPGQSKLWELLGIDAPEKDLWVAWTRFYRRSWFRRMWVIQEFISAQEMIIICGKHRFDPRYMRTLAKFSTMAHWYSYISQLNAYSGQNANPMFIQIESRDSYVDGKLSADDRRLLEIGCGNVSPESWIILMILRTRWKQASNPKDFIFVPLGIVKSLCHTDGELYNVDYNLEEFICFANVARHLLLNLPFLVLLSFCGRSCQYGTNKVGTMRRSWVPDFTARGMYPIGLLHRGCIAPYNASLARARPPHEYQAHRHFREADLAFGVRGIRIGQLGADIFDLLSTLEPRDAANMIPKLLQIWQASPATYRNGQPAAEALWRTIIDDVDVHGQYPAAESTRDEFRSWLAWSIGNIGTDTSDPELLDVCSAAKESLKSLRLNAEDDTTHQTLPSDHELENYNEGHVVSRALAGRYRRMIGLGNRVFFRTEQGDFGIATNRVDIGDEVWILEGGKTPFLLRPGDLEGEFRVVGEIYVHGVMGGEALGGPDGPEWKPIWLK